MMKQRILLSLLLLFSVSLLSDGLSQDTAVSASVRLEPRHDLGGRLARGNVRISPVAVTENVNARLTIDGKTPQGWRVAAPDWNSTAVEDGWHAAVLNEGETTASAELAVLNRDDVAIHGGVLTADETWSADKLHIVQYWVRIPEGKTLTIEDGAIVKFCYLTGMQVDGTLNATDVIFTSIADDTIGGDTDMNGDGGIIGYGAYDITGSGTKSLTGCDVRCAASLPVNTTWKSGEVYPVYGKLTIPAGVTLTIQPGAIVKFASGAELAAVGGSVNASGAVFTHIADDSIGGDTNGDGDATSPVSDAYKLTGFTPASDCELRYLTLTFAGGTISGTTTLMGNRVHKVTGNITIASGGKLVVQPGAIVKMNKGLSITVNSGGTLEAIGNRAQPIVFTSYRDDEHGGDTDGDDGKELPQPGDWNRIYAGGTIKMNYVTISYLNNASDNGAIQGTGGNVTFDNSVIEYSVYECVRMNSGSFTARNSIFREASMAFGYYGGSGVNCYNCVITDVSEGSRASNKHFYNCIFYKVININGSSSSFSHCIFYNPPGYGQQSYSKTGSNGNLWADPLFTNPAKGDFTLKAGSPCIDAGDGTVAPEFDYWGKPRMNVVKVADKGKPNADGVCPDIGIYEMPGSYDGACANLVAQNVTRPASVTSGAKLTVEWDVLNDGTATAEGPWRDTVVLKGVSEGLGGQVVELGDVTVTASLRALDTQHVSASFTVPPLKAGTWQLGVTTNAYRDVYEVKRADNQAFAETTLEVALPVWSSKNKQFAVDGYGESGFAVTASDKAQTVRVTFHEGANFAAFFADGYLPGSDAGAMEAVRLADGTLLLVIPAGAESPYITLANQGGGKATATVDVTATALSLLEATPASLTNRGSATVRIVGTGLTSGSAFTLANGATVVNGTVVALENGVVATAQFPMQGKAAGNYTLTVKEGGKSATLSEKLAVTADGVGPKLEAWLETPASVRDGRIYTAWLCYKNTGDCDMTMPLFEVNRKSLGNVRLSLDVEKKFTSDSLHIAGIGTKESAGILRTGEEHRIPFFFTSINGYSLSLKHVDADYNGNVPSGYSDVHEYLATMSRIATRLNLRAIEVYDVAEIQTLANRVKNGLPVSAISGQLVNAFTGEPLSEMTITAYSSTKVRYEVISNDSGAFQLVNLPDGEYSLDVEDGELQEEKVIAINDGQDVNGLRLMIVPYSKVVGYVVEEETQMPLEGITVRMVSTGTQYYDETTVTDVDGYFVFKGCPDGTYAVGSVGENGYVGSEAYTMSLMRGGLPSNVVIGMKHGGTIVGKVTNEKTWELLKTGQVLAKDEEENVYETELKEDGTFVFSPLRPGKYVVSFHSEDFRSRGFINAEVLEGQECVCDLYAVPVEHFYSLRRLGVCPFDTEFFLDPQFIRIEDVVSCEWDFDNDGTVDSRDLTPKHTYDKGGSYAVALKVIYRDGTEDFSVREDYVAVEDPVENVMRDNVIVWDEQTDFETRNFDKEQLKLSLVCKSNRMIDVGTVLVGEISDDGCEILKVAKVEESAEGILLTCVRGGLLDVYESCFFEVPVKLNVNDLQQESRTRGTMHIPTIDLIKGVSTVAGKATVKLDGDVAFSSEVVDGSFVYYLTPTKFRYSLDWILDMAIYPTLTIELSKSKNLCKSLEIPRIYLCKEVKFAVPEMPIPAFFSLYLDVNPQITVKGTIGWQKHMAFRGRYLSHIEAKMDYPISLALLTMGPGIVMRDSLLALNPNMRVTTVFESRKQEVPISEISDFDLMKDNIDVYANAEAEVGISLKPTARLSFVSPKTLVVTGGIDCHLKTKASFSTKKPTDIQVGAGINGFGSLYLWDFDNKERYEFIKDKTDQQDSASNPVGLDSLVHELSDSDKKKLDLWKFLQSIKAVGFSKDWADFITWNLGRYTAPEVDYEATPTKSEKIPAEISFSALECKNVVATGCFAESSPKIKAYNWNLGQDKSEWTIPENEIHAVYNKPGRYISSLSYDVSPIPSFMSKKIPIYIGDKEELPPPAEKEDDTVQDSPKQSCDPNEIAGMVGFGDKSTQRFVKPGEWLDYTVYFENKASAAVPAQEVTVTHALSKWLDWSTLELGEIAFNNQIQMELKGKRRGTATVPQADSPYHVKMTASTDETTGEFVLYLRSYDKSRQAYGYWPEPVDAGFLPPNDDTHRGEGHFTFRVKVRDDAPNGAFVNAEASVVFDHNAAIVTSPAWFNWVTTDPNAAADGSTLRWDTSDDATGTTYQVKIWTGDPDFNAEGASIVATSDALTTGSWSKPDTLESGDYFWHVKKTAADGTESWTSSWGFTMEASYTVMVMNGTGGGSYQRSDMVIVTADDAPAGKVFEAWTATGLTLTDEERTSETLSFLMPDHDVTLTAAYKEEKPAGDTWTLSLKAGWNWVSFPVLPLGDRKVGAVLGTTGFTANDLIQSSSSNARFTGSSWMPSSFTVDYGTLYKINVAKDTTVTLTGEACTATSVAVKAGWNWFGNPTDKAVTPAELTHSAGFSAGDRLLASNASVTYNGSKWIPSTGFSLEPGKGYQLYTAQGGTLAFGEQEPEPDEDTYVVVDLSGGPDAASYPVRYSATGPNVEDDTCRTTELWLRKIPAGTFMMGSPEDELGHQDNETLHQVTLTQDYYIGVFECTQKQWELVMGSNPSYYKGDCRPVEYVSYNMIRGTGAEAGAGWPTHGHAVDGTSFMGKLQAKTGLVFDLPTDAQWEYACRLKADGTCWTTALNSGKELTDTNECPNMAEVGRYSYNLSDGKGGYSMHTKVGSYRPSELGLYDMHGNVWEWCLDWDWDTSSLGSGAVENPEGPATSLLRVFRGGDCLCRASGCRSASRDSFFPKSSSKRYGFRIAMHPLPANPYLVVDLSGGPNATSYPVRYSTTGPDVTHDTCRTTELWLRKIPAGTFMMGSPEDELGRNDDETLHQVTLTQDYYIGVFECTQKQWELVMGNNPAEYEGDCRPVECVTYNMIRGSRSQAGAGWPTYSHAVDADSFMGRIQAKTGLTFDLPTEAQWEYACRKRTIDSCWTTALNSGKDLTGENRCANMDELGPYYYYSNCHSNVGSYKPSELGVYDMHGNVCELCLDWYASYSGDTTDPAGPASGSEHVLRGGGWSWCGADGCRSACRHSVSATYVSINIGFRVAMHPLPASPYLVVDLSGGPEAESYPVRYSATGPNVEDDTCRTTELWLRKIPAGTFMMGSPEDELGRDDDETLHQVTLTQDYYIGVFECTQKQWELVMGDNPSSYKGDCRPVEHVSYDMLRGTGEQTGAGWPTCGHAVDANSFMGRIQSKTGLVFDLPTEAQWEYACRLKADGTCWTTALNSGKNLTTSTSSCPNMAEVGRYDDNRSDGKGGYSEHTKVGSYRPSELGLYDMHGNVSEWCLDRYASSLGSEEVVNPVGSKGDSNRVYRSGDWDFFTFDCRSASRSGFNSSGTDTFEGSIISHAGFRVAVTGGCVGLSAESLEP